MPQATGPAQKNLLSRCSAHPTKEARKLIQPAIGTLYVEILLALTCSDSMRKSSLQCANLSQVLDSPETF